MRKNKKASCPIKQDNVVRASAEPMQKPQAGPFPMAQSAGAQVCLPNMGGIPVVSNGMPMGLPVYTSVDEYGRKYCPIMHYGPQTHSAPVPVAIAPSICQLNPIVSPVSFVPYAGQQQEMYVTTEEN